MQVELNSNCAGTEEHWEVQGSAWSPRVSSPSWNFTNRTLRGEPFRIELWVTTLYTHTLIAGQVSGKGTQEGLTEGGWSGLKPRDQSPQAHFSILDLPEHSPVVLSSKIYVERRNLYREECRRMVTFMIMVFLGMVTFQMILPFKQCSWKLSFNFFCNYTLRKAKESYFY